MPVAELLAKGLPWRAIDHLCVVGLTPGDADGLRKLALALAMVGPHVKYSLVMPLGMAEVAPTGKGHVWAQAHWQADEHGLIDTVWLAASDTSSGNRPA